MISLFGSVVSFGNWVCSSNVITDKLLYNWKAKCEAEQSGSILNADERAELLRLRKENKELRMEKDILKKASALLLRETK